MKVHSRQRENLFFVIIIWIVIIINTSFKETKYIQGGLYTQNEVTTVKFSTLPNLKVVNSANTLQYSSMDADLL